MARKQRGQALVEFALVVPVLLMLLLGIFEFGRVYLEYFGLASVTDKVAQAAARWGGNSAELDALKFNNTLPPLDPNEVTITITTEGLDDTCDYGETVTVEGTYPTAVTIFVFSANLQLYSRSTLVCWRGGAP